MVCGAHRCSWLHALGNLASVCCVPGMWAAIVSGVWGVCACAQGPSVQPQVVCRGWGCNTEAVQRRGGVAAGPPGMVCGGHLPPGLNFQEAPRVTGVRGVSVCGDQGATTGVALDLLLWAGGASCPGPHSPRGWFFCFRDLPGCPPLQTAQGRTLCPCLLGGSLCFTRL